MKTGILLTLGTCSCQLYFNFLNLGHGPDTITVYFLGLVTYTLVGILGDGYQGKRPLPAV